jgi:hypothetical protein
VTDGRPDPVGASPAVQPLPRTGLQHGSGQKRVFRPLENRVKTKKNPKNVQKKAKNTQKNPKTAIIAVGWLFEKICALTFNVLDAGTFTS